MTKKKGGGGVMSDEDICRWTSSLPDSVLLKAFDKPLEEQLSSLSVVEKTGLRVWWFNPNQWPSLDRLTKLKFIRFLLEHASTQHQIAEKFRATVVEVGKTLCGYNAVKGACTAGWGGFFHHGNKATTANHT